MIDPSLRRELLALARAALEACVRGECLPAVPTGSDTRAAGLFVTIYCSGDLRGCLGTLDPHEPLWDAVVRLAAEVSREDYRFRPISPSELPHVTMGLSVLTPAEQVIDPTVIEIGRDGLIIQQGRCKGLLLPQVATEHGWDRETFLAQTCVKAGLPADAWQRGATILRFQAEVFSDQEH